MNACNAPRVRAVRERFRDATGAIALVASNPGLRRLELAWAGSMIGTWAYGMALIVYAFGAGGATAVGVVGFVRWTAAALVAPFTGVLGDRLARVRVMVASDVARVIALGAAAAAAAADLPYVVYALAVVVSVASTAFRPAQAALVPGLARSPEELTAANVTATTIESVGIFAGPALGGLLLAVSSSAVVFGVTAGAMVWSALLLVRISEPARETAAPQRVPIGAEVTAGFRTIAHEGRVRLLVALFAAQTFVDGALSVLVAPFLVQASGIRWALVAVGAFLPAVVALTWRTLAAVDAASPVPPGLDLLREVPFLAPLPGPTLEALAGRLEPVRVLAGTTIIRRGDRGDRFYVVADGE